MQDADAATEHAANNTMSEEKPQASKKPRGKCCVLLAIMPVLLASFVRVQLSVMAEVHATVSAASLTARLLPNASTANNGVRHRNGQVPACFVVVVLMGSDLFYMHSSDVCCLCCMISRTKRYVAHLLCMPCCCMHSSSGRYCSLACNSSYAKQVFTG